MSAGSENWFDRMAAPHTRRQGLKAAAAGIAAAAAASLPFAGSVTKARAANPEDCKAGCVFTADKDWGSRINECAGAYSVNNLLSLTPALGLGLSQMYYILNVQLGRYCADDAQARFNTAFRNCYKPFCPGFDPFKAGGPCDGCTPPLYCNPCSTQVAGYICCVYPPGDCHGDCCTPGMGCP